MFRTISVKMLCIDITNIGAIKLKTKLYLKVMALNLGRYNNRPTITYV